ncbi:MAG: 50S ribosomal protein L25 [Deltaproteobacteria bacterium]
MNEKILLEAEAREEKGKTKVKELRVAGFIPAVIYGEGKPSVALKVSRHAFLQLMHQKRLENAIITLKVKGAKGDGHPCMIKEMQHEPVKGDIMHIDFNEISLTKAIKVNVPVVTKGEAVGVKSEGGSLEHILWEIEIECLPTDIPKNIEVDVSALKIGDSIHVKDIAFPANLKVLSDLEASVVTVSAPMKEEVAPLEGEEGAAAPEVEVIKEKKPEAEGEGKAEKEEKPKKEEKK